MDQTSHSIREKNIDLARFDNRRYLSFAKRRVQHCLSPAIGARAIIRRARLGRCVARCAALIGDARVADRATDARNPSCLAQGRHNMPALLATSKARLLDSISDSENLFLDHFAPSLVGVF